MLTKYNETREIEALPVHELDTLLCKFFMETRKRSGEEYEPDSLSSFQRSIQRHLSDKESSVNILKDTAFQRSRKVLAAKRKQLVGEGKGNKPNAARALTEGEEASLFKNYHLGNKDPQTVQKTLWWHLSLHFGFRARDESRKLRWGDVTLSQDPETGNEILVWLAERGTKTRTGKENGHQRAFNPTIQATHTETCPVALYKEFSSHRPKEMNLHDSPFFLAVNHRRKPDSQIWYMKSPLGKNEIGRFMSSVAKEANLPANGKKVSNHSVRKTSISRLLDANCPDIFVSQLSGHKSVESLKNYKTASNKHQRAMSNILSSSSTSQPQQISSVNQVQNQSTNNSSRLNITPMERNLQWSTPFQFPRSVISSQAQLNQHNSIVHTAVTSSVQQQPQQPQFLPIFAGASIGHISNCSFQFVPQLPTPFVCQENQENVPKRRRRAVIESDSDDD